MQGAVGDVLSHFLDKDGNPVETDIEDRLISTPLATLKELENVIAWPQAATRWMPSARCCAGNTSMC